MSPLGDPVLCTVNLGTVLYIYKIDQVELCNEPGTLEHLFICTGTALYLFIYSFVFVSNQVRVFFLTGPT